MFTAIRSSLFLKVIGKRFLFCKGFIFNKFDVHILLKKLTEEKGFTYYDGSTFVKKRSGK